jgi:hypothetical protein
MNQAEQQIFLEACDTAFLAFQHRNPDFVFSEALAREMALTLQAEKLDPRNVHHLSAAWLKVRQSAPTGPAPVSESSDPIEVEARRMLASGEVTVESVRALRSEDFALRCQNLAFCMALDLLPKPPRTVLATRADVVRKAVIAERASKNGILLAPYDPNEEVERSKREVSSGFADHREPAPRPEGGVGHWSGVSFGDRKASGIADPGKDLPMPKQINARDAEVQRKKDNEFMSSQRDLHARAARVRAHRAKQ